MPKHPPILDPIAEARRLIKMEKEEGWSGRDADEVVRTLEALIKLVERMQKDEPDWHKVNDVW